MEKMKLTMKRVLSVVLTMLFVFNLLGNANVEVYAADNKVETAISWAIGIANDNSHGYSQSVRWGPHYDCSSFVYSAFYQAGFSLPGSGTRYTQTMVNDFTKAGFTWIPWSQVGSMNNLQRGDILLNNSSNSSKQHTEIYLGNGQNVGAHSPSKGISVSGYYNHPWLGVLRYSSSAAPATPQPSFGNLVNLGDSFSARIRHCASGKVVTNSNYNGVIGTSMNEKIARQIWKFTRNSNGSYRIQSCLNMDYCLELHNFDDFDGGNVCCGVINGSTAQNWFIYQKVDGSLCLRPECSETRVLDLTAGNITDGNNMQVWSYVDSGNQKFGIDKCGEVINIGEDFSGFIMNSHYWKPIMQDGKSNVVLGTENSQNMAQQLWHFVRNPQNGYYTIESYYNGKVLTVKNSEDKDGANVTCYEKNGSVAQQWYVLQREDGSYYIKAGCSARNLDLNYGEEADGTNIQMWSNSSIKNQTFSIYQLNGTRDKISYDLFSDSASVDIGEKTKITVSNALYAVNYKLHIVSPNGKTKTVNLGTKNTYDFSADTKGIYKVYASVKSPVSSYSGSVNDKCITIAVGYDYKTSAEQSVVFQGHLYQLVEKQNVNWAQAKEYCEGKNSYLAAITSEKENIEVAKLVKQYGKEAYIGGIRKDDKNFRWVVASNEKFTYSNWKAGEPDYHNHGICQIRDPYGQYARENYIGMYPDGTWNDYMILSSAINAFVMESAASSIQVSEPTKVTYKEGDKFDKGGIVAEVTFSDGSKREVTEYTVSGFDSNKNGVQKVTISYYGLSQSIDVKVESDDIAEKEHDYVLSDTKKPTCTQDGYLKYICSNCGESYTETIPQTGHTWDAGKVTLKATETTEGIYTYTCTSCGETKTEKIPATGHAGDSSQNDKDDPDKDKTDIDDVKAPDEGKTDIDDVKAPDEGKTDIDDVKAPDEEKTEVGNEENPDEQTDPDENDVDSDGEKTPDVEEGEDPDILEVGDVVEDVSIGDEYEIISINGSEISVEYMESANSKAAVVKIPATIKTDNGTVCKVTSISKCAFKNNKKLKKIVIGNNVKVIGTKAFSGCKNLTSVSIGKNVVTIGANAFSGCIKLTNLTIPSNVEKIGSNAFNGCKKLEKLEIKSRKLNTKGVNKKAFKGIPVKTVIQVPKDKQKLYKKVLSQKGLGSKNKIR